MPRWYPTWFALLFALGSGSDARAQEQRERPWSNSADLSLVVTGGNSETMNLSLSDRFTYAWSRSELTVNASALRTETTERTLRNVGGEVVVEEDRNKTAEAYALEGRYRHTIRKGFTWFTGAGWQRNRFSGIDARWALDAGLGYRFIRTGFHELRAELGVNHTSEDRAGGDQASYAGVRGYLGYERALSGTSKLTSDVEILENLDEVEDWRAKSVTAVTASLTGAFALKASYTLLYDQRPVTVAVTDPTGSSPDATFAFDKTDQVLAASLVINF